MPSPSYSIIYHARLHETVGCLVGDVLVKDPVSGMFVKATAANRAAAGHRSTGIALQAARQGEVTDILQCGEIGPDVSGLGPGPASKVRVGANGKLERVDDWSEGDDRVGECDEDGTVGCYFRLPESGSTGAASTASYVLTDPNDLLDGTAPPNARVLVNNGGLIFEDNGPFDPVEGTGGTLAISVDIPPIPDQHLGDVNGDHETTKVVRINGAQVPAAGALTTGHVLKVNGTSSLEYGPLGNGSINNGAISAEKLTPGSAGQFLCTDGSTNQWGNTASYIGLGTTPASAGTIRLPTGSTVLARNSANTADLTVLQHVGSNSLYVGGDSAGTSSSQFTNISIYGTTNVGLGTGLTTHLSMNATNGLMAPAGSLSFGSSNFATAGNIRFRSSDSVYGRNAANSANIAMLALNGSNQIFIGQNPTGATDQASIVNVNATNDVFLRTAGTTRFGIGTSVAEVYVPFVQFRADVGNPTIRQSPDATASVTGDPLTVQAQSTTGTGSTGGALVLAGGTGTTASGNVKVQTDGADRVVVSPATASFYVPIITSSTNPAASGDIRMANGQSIKARNAANNADLTIATVDGTNILHLGNSEVDRVYAKAVSQLQMQTGGGWGFQSYAASGLFVVQAANGSTAGFSVTNSIAGGTAFRILPTWNGATSMVFTNSVTSGKLGFEDKTAASTNGVDLTVSGQNATGATSTGGNVNLTSGTGTTAAGSVKIQTGGTDRLTVAPTLITSALPIAFGSTPSTTDTIRWSPDQGISVRSTDNTTNHNVLRFTTAGNILVGTSVASGPSVYFDVPNAGGLHIRDASKTRVAFMSTFVDANVSEWLWQSGVTAPKLRQANLTTASATGQALTVQAQNATGATSTGGALNLSSGTGTTAAGAVNVQVGGTTRLNVTNDMSTFSSEVSIGTPGRPLPDFGLIRCGELSTDEVFLSTIEDGTFRSLIMKYDIESYAFGDPVVENTFRGSAVRLEADDEVTTYVGGNAVVRWMPTGGWLGRPLIGSQYEQSPWGADGDSTIVMASANKVLTPAEYSAKFLRFTGSLGANRTVTLPAVASGEGYVKEVWVDIASDFGIILTTGSGKTVLVKGTGTAASINRATISVTSAGVIATGCVTNSEAALMGN